MIPESKRDSFIKACERGILSEQECPLCPGSAEDHTAVRYTPTRLRRHLARHMQQIALFVLPNTRYENTDNEVASDANGTQCPRKSVEEEGNQSDTDKDSDEEESNLDFESNLSWVDSEEGGPGSRYEKALSPEHPDTLGAANNVANVHNDQGKHEEALQLYERALAEYEKTFGEDHPTTLDTVNNITMVFDNQGEYIKALEWYQRALDGKEKTLGRDHPSTLATVNNMAIVFNKQGEYIKALE